jgi:K+-transporting ATPase ATPase A chain
MEGKELRFGVAKSGSSAVATTASNGSVNWMHDSFMPLAGMSDVAHPTGRGIYGGVGLSPA